VSVVCVCVCAALEKNLDDGQRVLRVAGDKIRRLQRIIDGTLGH